MKKTQATKGYSLIELLVYLSIFSILCLVIIKSLVTSMTVYSQSQSYRKIQAQGELVMERMTRELRQATSVTGGNFDANPGSITLAGKDLSGNPDTVAFSVVNNQVQISVNGVNSTLTGGQVASNSLIFRKVTTSNGSAVKVELQLQTVTGYKITVPFNTTVLLRGK
ncbi:MAG: prepilin-type N-terminal cleavage/methylation domain-containing protein [bacterium]